MLGPEQEVAVGLSDKRHPKVGNSYTLKESETQAGEEGEPVEFGSTEVTLTFKSAKLVVVKLHLLSKSGDEVSCVGGATRKVKRQG